MVNFEIYICQSNTISIYVWIYLLIYIMGFILKNFHRFVLISADASG